MRRKLVTGEGRGGDVQDSDEASRPGIDNPKPNVFISGVWRDIADF